jgi:hypothetical protein
MIASSVDCTEAWGIFRSAYCPFLSFRHFRFLHSRGNGIASFNVQSSFGLVPLFYGHQCPSRQSFQRAHNLTCGRAFKSPCSSSSRACKRAIEPTAKCTCKCTTSSATESTCKHCLECYNSSSSSFKSTSNAIGYSICGHGGYLYHK